MEALQIYLPIAGISINILTLIAIGVGIGVMSGMFGLGGGIFLVPTLIAIGVPSQVAVATSTNQMTAASFSGFLAYSRRGRVDYKLGSLMLIGGIFGSFAGMKTFEYLRNSGTLDIFIAFSLFILLLVVGTTTARDAIRRLYYKYKNIEKPKSKHSSWMSKLELPYQQNFISCRKTLSVFSPIIVGLTGGYMVSLMGIGGSLVMLPAMIYIMRVSDAFIPGTTHFQIIFTTIVSTILHSVSSHNLDIILSTILIVGTSFGVQIGAKIGSKFQPENYRLLLAFLMFILCIVVAYGLFIQPSSIYVVEYIR